MCTGPGNLQDESAQHDLGSLENDGRDFDDNTAGAGWSNMDTDHGLNDHDSDDDEDDPGSFDDIQRAELERHTAERFEAERHLEAERIEAEHLEAERREAARLEAERACIASQDDGGDSDSELTDPERACTISDIPVAQKFIALLETASLNDTEVEPLDETLRDRIRNPPTSIPTLDNPNHRLSLDIFLSVTNVAEETYKSICASIE
ncbi:hypothetical protein FISHEDRAFT_78186 [Fistulina hepatica ATCC 64428]|nr:hypothetical protein FISHEDRAFT_78186 [Fistulina hepatica ATCC 64428]